MEESRLFVDLGLLLLAALGGGILAQALRQPPIVGYIGVDFSIGELLRVRRPATLGALGGIALLLLLTLPVGRLLGWSLTQSLAVGAAVSVGSTMVLLKFLLERGELTSSHGRVAVGISLVEDLAVVAMVILLPVLGATGGGRVIPLAQGLLQAVLLLVPLLWFARRVFPEILARVARTRNTELFLLVVVVVAIGTAALTASLGLSLALGAFLAGLVISESEFAHETLARILPIRDVTILINALVFRRTPRWLTRAMATPAAAEDRAVVAPSPTGHVLICGYGRVGREVADALIAFNVPFAVVDLDPEATRAARARGALAVFGDAGNEPILHRAGAERARLAVVAMPDVEAAHRCVHALRRIREDLPILARLHQRRHRALLLEAGATEVVQPEVEAALTLVRHSLDRLGRRPCGNAPAPPSSACGGARGR